MSYAVRLDNRGCRAVKDASECTVEEYYSEAYVEPVLNTLDLLQQLRNLRDIELDRVIWMTQRHEQQKLINVPTTITDDQYIELLQYIEQLRQLPNISGSPWDGGGSNTPWPTVPSFVKSEL
jgi:hypothetical protein